jgi:hypothetical protein
MTPCAIRKFMFPIGMKMHMVMLYHKRFFK